MCTKKKRAGKQHIKSVPSSLESKQKQNEERKNNLTNTYRTEQHRQGSINMPKTRPTVGGTCGRMPVKKRSVMKPFALGLGSNAWKLGSDFPETITGTRRPSSACWPRAQDIYRQTGKGGGAGGRFTVGPTQAESRPSHRYSFRAKENRRLPLQLHHWKHERHSSMTVSYTNVSPGNGSPWSPWPPSGP